MIQIFDYIDRFNFGFSFGCIENIEKIFKDKDKICCNTFPNCTHPKIQTYPYLLDENIEHFKLLKETFLLSVEKYLNKNFKYSFLHSWCYKNKKSQQMTEFNWHNHKEKNLDTKGITEISGLFYLNDTEFGTEFETEDYFLRIKPKKYIWYLWPSSMYHRPEPGISNNDRYTIAASIGVIDNS
jgi:hypothetical protein